MQQNSSDLQEYEVEEGEDAVRLDVFLAGRIEDASRSYIKKLVKEQRVKVNNHDVKRPSRVMQLGDVVLIDMPEPDPVEALPEDIPLEIMHNDDDVVVVNKPAGLVVHPAPGHPAGTLVNALLFHCGALPAPDGDATRPGIVHRLDRDTSGVMVVAKSRAALVSLGRQAHDHLFDRRYLALVRGEFKEDKGTIDADIGRSLADRKRMAVTGVSGRHAITRFEVIERFGIASLIALQLETGRTHQIRVHTRFAGRPILGDPVYGITDFRSWDISDDLRAALAALPGQALHAEHLGFEHPTSGKRLSFTTPPPEAFGRVVELLRNLRNT